MPQYAPPEQFKLDSASGLYYQDRILYAPDGRRVRHIYWFDANSGTYTQQLAVLEQHPVGRGGGKKKHAALKCCLLICVALVVLVGGIIFTLRMINSSKYESIPPEQMAQVLEAKPPDEETMPKITEYKGALQINP